MAILITNLSPLAYASDASSTDGLAGYSYVKTHQIVGSRDGALQDFQVKLVIHNSPGTDNGQDAYLNGLSMSWPNDFRFTDNSNNVFSYWIESFDSEAATVWVKVNRIAAWPGTTTLKIYYGKANDPGASSGRDTFILFEDFGDDSRRTTAWTENTVASTTGRFTDVQVFENGGYHVKQNSKSDRGAEIVLAGSLGRPTVCRVTLEDISEVGTRTPAWITTRVGYNANDYGPGYWGGVQGYDTLPGHTYVFEWSDGYATGNLRLYENDNLITTASANFGTSHKPDMGVRTASDAMGEWYFRRFLCVRLHPESA